MCSPDDSDKPLSSDEVRELVSIGAAIAANCEPCFKLHFDKARKLGVSNDDMNKAVEVATMVKAASAQNVIDLAAKYLQREVTTLDSCETAKACCS